MIPVRTARAAARVAVVTAVAALAGCGGPSGRGDVTGKIRVSGQAPGFPGLQVIFTAPDGAQTAGLVGEDGSFTAEGVAAGENRVSFVFAPPLAEPAKGPRMRRPDGGAAARPAAKQPAKNPVREELREPSTSGVTFQVHANQQNVFEYDLPPLK